MSYAKRWRLLLFGDPKTGKTSLAETAPGPRLILDAEGGTDWLASETIPWNPLEGPPPDVEGDVSVVVEVLDWELLERITPALRKGQHPFRSIILDSLTELQKRAKRLIAEGSGMRQQDWGALYDRMDPVLREIRDLTKVPGSKVDCVVLTALAVTKDEKIIPDIQGSMARSLAGQVDTLGYLQAGSMNADGTTGRELVIDPRHGIGAGDRTKILRRTFHGVIPIDINEETDELSWNITELLDGMNEGFADE